MSTATPYIEIPAALRKPGRKLGYARVSTDDQHPESQETRLRADGCSHVWTDKGASGAKASRPEWDKLRGELREGDTLVCVKLDRIGRSVANLDELREWFDANGVTLRVLDQAIDTSTSTGRLMFRLLASIAEFERELIIERTRDGQAEVRRIRNLRRSCGGPAPLGLLDPGPVDDDRRDWVTEPEAAALIARVAVAILPPNGESLSLACARELDDFEHAHGRRLTDSKGIEVNEKMMRSALRRPASAGLIDADDAAPVIDAPALDVFTFRKLRALFESRQRPGRITSDDDPYWAGPLLVCSKCGNQLTGSREKNRGKGGGYVNQYRCANRHKIGERDGKPVYNVPCHGVSIRADDVNDLVRAAVEGWADGSKHLALAALRQEGIASARADLADELIQWQGMLDDLLPTQRVASRAAFTSARDEIIANLERVERELSALDDERDPLPVSLDWAAMPGAERRRFAREIVATPIRVSPGKGGGRPTPSSERVELLPFTEAAA